MTDPSNNFGKRQQRLPDMAPAPKRSGHVALLVMGTLAVGGTAYALMPSESCKPPAETQPGVITPSPATTPCTTRTSSSGGGGSGGYSRGSHWSFFGGSSSSGSSASGSSFGGSESSSHISRGGFGSFGHMFSGGG